MAAKRDAATTATAMLALAPGFVLPFVLTQRLGPGRSDLILLAASVGMTLVAILGNAIEMSTVAQVGRQAGLGRRFSRTSLRRYTRRLLLIVLPAVVVVGAALILLYGWHADDRDTFVALAAVLCVLPVVGTFSSIRSGQLIALGRSATAISVQALRTAVPLVLVLVWSQAPLWVLAAGYVVGEALRLVVLSLAVRRSSGELAVTDDDVDHRGLLWQSASLATAQSGPATDRAFLNSGPAGSIAGYEIADKVFYAGLQVVSSGFLLRRLGRWSQLVTRDPRAVRAMLRRELFVFGAIASVCAVLGIATCWLALAFAPVPDAWRTGVVWASIILVSLPMSAIGTACARLFVIGGRASLLVRFSIGFTLANAALDALGFALLGVVGIPIATVVARLGAMVCYLLVLRRNVVPRLEAAGDPPPGRVGEQLPPPSEGRQSMSNVRPALKPVPVLAVAVVASLVVVLGLVSALSPVGTLVVLGLALLAVAMSLPLWLLPSAALWMFALLPIGYLEGIPPFVGRFWTPAAIVLGIWLVRLSLGRGRRAFLRSLRWVVPLTVLLLALGFQGLSSTRSTSWTLLLVVAVALPTALAATFDNRTSATLLRSWITLGIGLSLVAVLESLVKSNPLAAYYNFDQHWALYRVTTTLGHPLMNGTFFAVTACVAVFSMVRRDGARASAFVCFALAALSAGLTGSRSGVYALVSGLGVGLIVMLLSGRTSVANKLLGLALGTTALLVLPALPTIAGRASSAEGIASGLYRDQVVKLAGQLFLANPWLGYGPGTSLIATARSGAKNPLENSVLGSLVSLGVVGSVAVLFVVVLVLVTVLRGARPDGIGALAAFVVSGSAFPLWESNPAALVLVGLVVVATRVPVATGVDDPVPPLVEEQAVGHAPVGRARVLTPAARVVRT